MGAPATLTAPQKHLRHCARLIVSLEGAFVSADLVSRPRRRRSAGQETHRNAEAEAS